ncbi:MAG: GAF domain-containing sensor histidine kinase [Pseudomonadota bacterium]
MLYWKAQINAHTEAWQACFGSEAQAALDRSTWLISQALSVPVALVTLVGETRQVFQSQHGLGEPWATVGETPLTHSFCQHCVADGRPFVVEDARSNARVEQNLAVSELGVVAYLGVPLQAPDGAVIGAVCAIDTVPRAWGPQERAVLEALAASVETEFRRCAEIARLRDAASRAQHQLHAQNAFLTTLGHELRTLLNGITGGTELLRATTNEKARPILDMVSHAAELMAGFTDDVLELDRMARSKVKLEQAPFSPHALMRAVHELFRMRVAAGVVLRLDLSPDLPASWTGDARRFEQVLINLTANAVKFTQQGAIVLSAHLEPGWLVLRVSDTGPGIAKADRQRIFRRFEKAGAQGAFGAPGFGLGLAISAEIAERTGAVLSLEETRVPGGSTFRFAIPAPAA